MKIKFVSSSVLKDYAGMNYYAAKSIGFKKIKPNEILIDKSMSKKDIKKTIAHEIVESKLMKNKKMSYWKAHELALKMERFV